MHCTYEPVFECMHMWMPAHVHVEAGGLMSALFSSTGFYFSFWDSFKLSPELTNCPVWLTSEPRGHLLSPPSQPQGCRHTSTLASPCDSPFSRWFELRSSCCAASTFLIEPSPQPWDFISKITYLSFLPLDLHFCKYVWVVFILNLHIVKEQCIHIKGTGYQTIQRQRVRKIRTSKLFIFYERHLKVRQYVNRGRGFPVD